MKIGDVVRLKSGGPYMTVGGAVDPMIGIHCLWFCGAELKAGMYPTSALEVIAPEDIRHPDCHE